MWLKSLISRVGLVSRKSILYPEGDKHLFCWSVFERDIESLPEFLLSGWKNSISGSQASQTFFHKCMFSWPGNHKPVAITMHLANNYSEFPKAFQFNAVYFPYNNIRRTSVFLLIMTSDSTTVQPICNIKLIAGHCNNCKWMAQKWQTIRLCALQSYSPEGNLSLSFPLCLPSLEHLHM